MNKNNNYPVVLFVYKRHHSIKSILESIRASGAQKIYIFADGPKYDGDRKYTDKVKLYITKFMSTNRDLTITPHFRSKNLGLKTNILNGLDLVFSSEDAAIILEDDCMPSPDFFRFSSEMLTRYQANNKIMSITGTSVGGITGTSYGFSKYQICWGWATWKRAWQNYDREIKGLTSNVWSTKSFQIWNKNIMRLYWRIMLMLTKAGQIDTWDFQWSFSHFFHNGLAVVPAANLIQNIGTDEMATNMKTRSPFIGMPTSALSWPLIHPQEVIENKDLSDIIELKYYRNLIAYLGMLRQIIRYYMGKYAHRD